MSEITRKTCAACASPFDDVSPSRNRRFCTNRCRCRAKERRRLGRPEADAGPSPSHCVVCSVALVDRKHGTQCCSEVCDQRRRGRLQAGKPVADPPVRGCERCGEPIRRSHWNSTRFCSVNCASAWHLYQRYHAKRPVLERDCLVCGKPISPDEFTNKKYCDRQCAGRNRAPEVVFRYIHARRLLLASGTALHVSRRTLRRLRSGRCSYCPAPAETVDHVVPLNRGGRHAEGNLAPACRSCNSSKGDRYLFEWLVWRKATAAK